MQISAPAPGAVCNEVELMLEHLPLAGARLLELGCGSAVKTRALAERSALRAILALEVDARQHAKNLLIDDLPQVTFAHGGAEQIPAPDASIDIVVMLKSLHHVPLPLLDQALAEIRRVLVPGGLAWISEPVYAGALNEVMRLFHDEKTARAAAFAALQKAVAAAEPGGLRLLRQFFFQTRSHYADFAEFDARMIRVTHSDHQLSPALYQQVAAAFNSHLTAQGASFFSPQRVDLLQKAA